MILRPPFKVSHGHSWLQSVFHSYLNCPILVASGLHNGSIQAFLTRRLREERKAECSPSLSAYPYFFVSYLLLVFLCRVVSKSSSQLLSPPKPTRPLWCQVWSEHPSLPSPSSQTPVWTHVSHSGPSPYSRTGTGTVIVCLHYLCRCTVCSKWLRNAIIHSRRPLHAPVH